MVLGLRGFPDVQGGVETHAEQLYPRLARSGCEVDVIVRKQFMRTNLRAWNGIRFHPLWAPRKKGIEAFVHTFLGVIYAALIRPDVLHIHAVGPAIMTPLARLLGLRVVVTHHGPDYDREKWGTLPRAILRLGERWGMRYASQRIVISEVIRKLVSEKHRRESVVIPNGVALPDIPESTGALEKFALAPGRYVLNVGRFVPEKRQIDLIKAFAASQLQDWKLVLVGATEPRDHYVNQVFAEAEKTPGVVLTGFQSGLALRELYANARIFVLPSSHEGLPIALLEALSFGIPVLASDIPANLEVSLPERAYFPLGDVSAIAAALRNAERNSEGRTTRDQVQIWLREKYDWGKCADQTLAVYTDALRGSKRY